MSPELPPALPDDNKHALRQVVRSCVKATLCTLLAEDGAPYGSLVTLALDHDLSPILLLSGLSDHTRNLAADPRVSLLFDGTEGHPNPQTGPRVTVMGRAERSDDPRLRARFLARHPAAALYAGFADFGIWRVEALRVHFVGGFGRAVWFSTPFGLNLDLAAALADGEAEVRGQSIPTKEGRAEVIGWDADGIDVIQNDVYNRIAFGKPVETLEEARESLKNLQLQGPF